MAELSRIGGVQPIMKMLLEQGLLHGDCLTVTGKTLAENMENVAHYPENEIIRGFDNPIKPDSHLVIFYGNLAPTGAVGKISGKEGLDFTGSARVFDGEELCLAAILDGTVQAGDVSGDSHRRPQRRPRNARDAVAHLGDYGQRTGEIGSHSSPMAVFRAEVTVSWSGHITPEAFEGGPIALVQNGDKITISAEKARNYPRHHR
jgi:dihydroxy-acid dehydratase